MTMPLDQMRQDLEAELAALDALVAGLTAAQWARPTPSEGWAVRDQIAHLAQFDDVAAVAMGVGRTNAAPSAPSPRDPGGRDAASPATPGPAPGNAGIVGVRISVIVNTQIVPC